LTTNGILLAQHARELQAAGLARLKSASTRSTARNFASISRSDDLPKVLEGIDAARRAGFAQIKLNTVAVRGQSEDDVVPLARFARHEGLGTAFHRVHAPGRRWPLEEHRVLSGKKSFAC